MRALPAATNSPKIFLPVGTTVQQSVDLRAQGYVTLQAFHEVSDVKVEAKRLGCSHVYLGDQNSDGQASNHQILEIS